LLRRLMPLLHLCADASVERKREEGGFMLYYAEPNRSADRSTPYAHLVPPVDTTM